MAFNSGNEVRARLLQNSAALTREEIRDLFQWIGLLTEAELRALNLQLALLTMQSVEENRNSIDKFNRSSTRLSWALLLLTIVYTVATILQVFHK